MRKKIIVFVISFLSGTTALYAANIQENAEQVGKYVAINMFSCFQKVYNDPQFYTANYCHENTRNLYRECFAPSIPAFNALNISKGHVIYILRLQNDEQLHVEYPRNQYVTPMIAKSGAKNWNYHVLLEFNGFIYDLDYTTVPLMTDVNSYFRSMFYDSLADTKHKYVVRVIPAEVYLNEYTEYMVGDKDAWYWISDRDKRFPMEYLTDYVARHKIVVPEAK